MMKFNHCNSLKLLVRVFLTVVFCIGLTGSPGYSLAAQGDVNILVISPVINEFVADHTGADTFEYVEIFGGNSYDYSSYTVIHIEGDSTGAGVIDSVLPVGTTSADGYWKTDYMSNEIENGTITLLLVENFTGYDTQDLDINNDGTFDETPWSGIVDSVAIDDGGVVSGDKVYSSVVLVSGFDGISLRPGGASRIPNGVDTDTVSDWMRNDFDGAGLPGMIGTLSIGEAKNTPGYENETVSPVINEFVANHTGTDVYEFIEIFSIPNTNLSSYTLLEIEGDTTGSGVIDGVYGIGTTDSGGFWWTGYDPNGIENGSITLLLVKDFTGDQGDDLDVDDDGILDTTPWGSIVDSVAVSDGGVNDSHYSSTILTPTFDGGTFTPGGASRIPDGLDTDTTSDWVRNDFDGAGLPTYVGTPETGEAINTPGYGNVAATEIGYSLTKDAPMIVPPLEVFTYTLTIENNSYITLTNVVLTDVVPTEFITVTAVLDMGIFSDGNIMWNLGDIPNWESLQVQFVVQAADFDGELIINQDYYFSSDSLVDEIVGSPVKTLILEGPLSIHHIQGTGHYSPFTGQTITNVAGIVTVKVYNGFYMQEPNPDTLAETSEGIFVYTGSAPAVNVGDLVSVSGNVSEYYPGGESTGNLSTTEITNPTIGITSVGNQLPAPVVVSSGGRLPPNEVIENDANMDVNSTGVFDPLEDGIDFYESLEGMLVQVNDAVAVSPTNAFGEIAVVGDSGAYANLMNPRGGLVLRENDYNPERIIIDDAIIADEPQVTVGTAFTQPVIGVMDYDFGNFHLLNIEPLSVSASTIVSETTTLSRDAAQITVATFNVENLDPGDPQIKFDQLADQIVYHLLSPDILALEEIQDNNGATDDGVVDASDTYNKLIDAITTAGGPTYDFRDIAPVNNADGGEPGANIRVGFLFRTDRGVDFIDRSGGDATTPVTVTLGLEGPELSFSPGRIDPLNTAFTDSRKPLAAEFTFKDRKIFVIANHLNSKGGDQYLFGRYQPPTFSSESQRIAQAEVINAFVDDILALDAHANIVVLGDLNDFQFSMPIKTLAGDALLDTIDTLDVAERYTYLYDGNSEVLDHILVNNLMAQKGIWDDTDIVHVNAEFLTSNRPTDHDPVITRLSFHYKLIFPLIFKNYIP
jgi:uncharacterized repeat protein (TIGR01451 family)